jgi:hypothetical protein
MSATKHNLEARLASLNRRMESRNSIYRYELEYANGRTGLIRTRPISEYREGKLVTKVVHHSDVRYGTKGQILEFMYAMMVALDDADYRIA